MNAPKQQLHGIPMYRILSLIIQMNTPGQNGKKRWATANRIAKEIGEPCNYVLERLDYYWGQNHVKKLPVKKASKRDNSADGSSFHWVITNKGKRKCQKLMERFGDVAQFSCRHLALISVQPGESSCDKVPDRNISVHACAEIRGDIITSTRQKATV